MAVQHVRARTLESARLLRLQEIRGLDAAERTSSTGAVASGPLQVASWGHYDFALDGSNLVIVKGRRIHLHPRQFAVAITFFCNLEQTVSQETLLNLHWNGSRASNRSRALIACISQFRSRLSLGGESGFTLLRALGRGYRLTLQPLSWL
jgi:DNA-binding response OmpR family regulator